MAVATVLGRLVLVSVLAGGPAWAQDALGPRLQDAIITAHGNRLTIKRLPVRTAAGVVYRDVTIELQVDASGAVAAGGRGASVSRISSAASVGVGRIESSVSVPEVAAPFTAGTYRADDGSGLVQVIRNGRDVGAEFPTWSLSSLGGGPISGAHWYAGPIRTNPRAPMLHRVGIDSPLYSYGTSDSGAGGFDNGMLIGAVQQGRKLTLVSFHLRGCCTYSPTPVSQVSYTLIGHR